MAWLILVLVVPVLRFPGVPAVRADVGRPQAPRVAAEVNQQVSRRSRRRRTATPSGAGSDARVARPGPAEQQPRCAAARVREHRGDHHRLPRLLRRHAARGGPGRAVRAHRVLHLGVGRHDRAVLRVARGGRRAGRRRPVPVRPSRARAGSPATRSSSRAWSATKIRWAPMLPIRAAQGRGPAAGPAQPPQDPRGRRPGRLHRLAEPDRARLQQAEEPQGRARVGRADGPGAWGRPCASSTSCSRPTGSARPARACARSSSARRRPRPTRGDGRRRSAPRSCRAGPASPPRTTCGCSTACCTPPSGGSR